jgi:hypothetical protein
LLAGKVALGCLGTLVLAGAYTCHEGILRVDEDHGDGRRVHVWVPAAVVPMALHVVPRDYLADAARNAGPWLPTVRVLAKELAKYPDAELVDLDSDNEHVHIRTHLSTLLIDVQSPGENVHVACPLATIEHVAQELAADSPAI